MDIIICDFFAHQANKFRWKQVIDREDFADTIMQAVQHNIIYLKRPIGKLKINYSHRAIRLLIMVMAEDDQIIPLYISDKNDKQIGENMNDETIRPILDQILYKVNHDLANKNYTLF
jgi:hypothetical protein